MRDAWATVVTREPEWNDNTRDLALGLAEYDEGCCPGCGIHSSVLDDPEHNHFTFEERLCGVCKSQDVWGRILAERDDKAIPRDTKGQPVELPPNQIRPSDGRHVYLRRMSPDEVEARRIMTRANGGNRAH